MEPPLAAKASKPPPKPKEKRLKNMDKVGLQEYYPELAYWSVTHANTKRDVDKATTIKYFGEFLEEKCELGVGFCERQKKMLKLHLQAWVAIYCSTDDSGKRAFKALWYEWFAIQPGEGWSIEIAPFQKRQNPRYMSGYVCKSNDLDNCTIDVDYCAKGEAFRNLSDLKKYKRDYFVHCPAKEKDHAAQFTKANLIAYAVNYHNRHNRALKPKPSLGRTLTWMVQSGDYEPSTTFLSTGYPIDRARAELMFDLLTGEPKNAKKSNIVDFIFVNNESQHAPIMDTTPHANPHYGPFGPDGNHPFEPRNLDWEGSEYGDMDYDEANKLNTRLNGETPEDSGIDMLAQTCEFNDSNCNLETIEE